MMPVVVFCFISELGSHFYKIREYPNHFKILQNKENSFYNVDQPHKDMDIIVKKCYFRESEHMNYIRLLTLSIKNQEKTYSSLDES